jgi:hypothetical protein
MSQGVPTPNSHYSNYDSLKVKLRIPDDSIIDEIELYQQETDTLINNRLRAKLGNTDANGNAIVLPLTSSTYPIIDDELISIANDLVEGKFRFKTTQRDIYWKEALGRFDEYMDRTFGWTENHAYRNNPQITISPNNGSSSTVVTVTGIQFLGNAIITGTFSGIPCVTTPSTVVTDNTGAFSFTFPVPTNQVTGSYVINCTDGTNGSSQRFRVN